MPRKTKSSQRRNGPRSMRTSIPHPPQFEATRRTFGRARFAASGSVTAITRGNLLNHLIACVLATSSTRLLSSIRVKSIQMWSSTTTLGGTSNVSVEWLSEQGPSKIISDTSVGTAEPAYISSAPPPQSLAGYWSFTGSDESVQVMIITAAANAIVDLTYEAVFQNGETPTLVTTTNSGVTGQVYMAYLAGPTTTTFLPLSYVSLT